MSPLSIVLVILLVLLLVGAFPVWPYAAAFGYGPSGVLLLILVVILVLAVMGKL